MSPSLRTGQGVGANQPVHWFLGGKSLGAGANQPVHWFFGGKSVGIQVYGLVRPNPGQSMSKLVLDYKGLL